MTEQEFIDECAFLGLTHREQSDKSGPYRIIADTEIGGIIPIMFKPGGGDGDGYVLGWSWSFQHYQSVIEAVLAAQADGMPILIDPIKIAGLAFSRQRENEGPRGS